FFWTAEDSEDDEVFVSNIWRGPDGQELLGDTLTSIQTQTGEVWELEVYPRDSLDDGPVFITEILIGNTAPIAPSVSISPQPGRTEAVLGCSVATLDDLDPDEGQDLSLSWSWTRDGLDAGITEATVAPSNLSAGEEWICSAVVNDGQADSPPGTASTTIVPDLLAPSELQLEDQSAYRGLSQEQYIGNVDGIGSPGDINGDGLSDFVIPANDEVCDLFCEGQAHAYLFLGGSSVGGDLEDADADLLVPPGFKVQAPWPVGDLNGDGIDDLLLPFEDGAGATTAIYGSGFYLVFGSTEGWSGELDMSAMGSRILNPSGEAIGSIPCTLGDIDGDGYADLGVASPLANLGSGRLYVVYGHPGNWPSDISIADLTPSFQIVGGGAGQTMATACAGPVDVDSNGYSDIVVSAAGAAAQGQGRVLVYLMDSTRLTGSHLSVTADHIIDGDPVGPGGFGLSMVALGDHDADGIGDFAVFGRGPITPHPTNPTGTLDGGTAWIVSPGHADFAPVMTHEQIAYRIEGGGDLGFCGHMAAVDINGDGLGDLACGNVRPGAAEDLGHPADVRIFFGRGNGLEAARSYSEADLVLQADAYTDLAGLSLAGLLDRNEDNYSELLVGAPGWGGATPNTGSVYVVDLAE
ncbi:MAG: FG-GAP repeat protein, partial [Myxococcota bacterium]|nr:FG-GAP repeat protein [Myxococcota bacterium]